MFKHKQTGFTLVELIIAVAIITIVASIAFPTYRTYIENSRIRTAAESIQNGLQKARSEAVLKNANVTFTLSANSDWAVGCTVPVTADNNGDGLEDCPTLIAERSDASGTIQAVDVAAQTQVIFTNLGTRVAGGLTQITIDNSALTSAESRELRVTINGASVRMCDPSAPVGNLKAC